jgi:predicted NUDIX family NTP pyrophosphohydrolase
MGGRQPRSAPAGRGAGARGKTSAGVLVYRCSGRGIEVLLVHPGGPFWARRDLGAWSIPKGEPEPGEEPEATARRELEEETGLRADGPLLPLGAVRQKGGKRVEAWALEGDFDPGSLRSGTFELEWPPHSGRRQSFPEVDRAAWFDLPEAQRRILEGQLPLLAALERLLQR